jgi:ATP-dependent RNA helicase RhlB
MKFNEFDLNRDLLNGIEGMGFSECMEVQAETLRHTLAKKDAYVQSQTGSGKTAAFLITIFELFQRKATTRQRALVIVPTRELAVQIEREAKEIGRNLPFRVGSIYGGVGYADQLRMLKEGYEIIIGTPGRLIDLAQTKKLNLRDVSILVIDEADRLFDMGFLPDIRKMLRNMSAASERMTMLFSATLNTRVWQVSWEYMNDPVEIIMNPEQLTVDEIIQELYHVSRDEKVNLLLGILEKEKPENALIFANTKSGAYDLAQRLNHNGYSCRYIIGDLPQKKRIKVIDQLKARELQFLVATDVAARGLHVDDLALVVNFDLPEDPENYVHRIGRTARAGNTGKAISLACERFVYGLEAIEKLIDMKIPVKRIVDELMVEDKSAGSSFNRFRESGSPHPRRRPAERPQRRAPTRTAPRPQRRQADRRPPQRGPADRRPAEVRMRRDMQLEDRLEYYRKKYGEDFTIKPEESTVTGPESSKPSVSPPDSNKTGFFTRLIRRKRR